MIQHIRKYRSLYIIGLVLCATLFYSASLYAYNVGTIKNLYMVGSLTQNIFSVGASPPVILPSNGSILLLALLPVELAGVLIVILALRLKAKGTGKAIIMTAAIAIFLILTFVVINSMLNVFR